MKKYTLIWILVTSFVIKSVLACITELNNDEVYYWTYAQKLQWNYFDHPPGIAILLRIFTFNGWLEQEFFLRLGSMICCAISTWLIYCIGKKIKNETSGLVAALLFTASPYCSLIAGWLVIPDAPQLVFWLGSVLLTMNITETSNRNRKRGQQMLWLGVMIGCCILCKVHGVFLWIGFLGYCIFCQRRLLNKVNLFYGGLISIVIISPIFFWNLSNDFISYRFHSARVSFLGQVQPDSFFRELLGGVLYNNPVVYVVIIAAVVAAIRKKTFAATQHQQLLLWLALPMILLVLFMAIFRDTMPHWTGPAFTTLIPLAAAYIVYLPSYKKIRVIPSVTKWALGITIVLLIGVFSMLHVLPGPIGKNDDQHLGDGDPLLDMSGFREFGNEFHFLYLKDLDEKKITGNVFLLSDNWFPAAHIDYYVAKPNHLGFMAVGSLTSIHHFAWLNETAAPMQAGADAYFITVSNNYHALPEVLARSFSNIAPPVFINQYRAGTVVRHFFIYRLTGYKGNLPVNGVAG